MITRRDKRNIIIASIIVIILIIVGVLLYLYFTTDLFKSNQRLFAKYLGNATQNVEALLKDEEGKQYEGLLENNKYTSNTEITAEYTNNIGTSDENNRNDINTLKLTADGKTDKLNGLSYLHMLLKKDETNISEMEYLKSEDKYGLRFTDLFNQYLVANKDNVKDVIGKIGIDNKNIPSKIEDIDLKNSLMFTDEELNNMNESYVNVINDSYGKESFSSLKKSEITVRDQSMRVNSYTLSLTTEQLNNVYISLLEHLKQDETILSKADIIEQFLNPKEEEQEGEQQEENNQQNAEQQNAQNQQIDGQQANIQNQQQDNQQNAQQQTNGQMQNVNGQQSQSQSQNQDEEDEEETKTIREKLIEKIDAKITEIKNTNIGGEEAKITVYESQGQTVKTSIEAAEYRINIETIVNGQDVYVKYTKELKNEIDENKDEIILNKEANSFSFERERTIARDVRKTKLLQERTITDGKRETTTTFTYDIGKNKIEIKMVDQKEVVNEFKEEKFTNNNAVILSKLSAEQLAEIKNTLNDKLIEKVQSVSEQVDFGGIFKILNELEVLPEQITIEELVTLTRSEVSKFNAEFEIYKGQQVDVKAIERLLELVKENLDTVEVLSEKSIKLNIVRGNKNEELANKVVQIINEEKNVNKKYSIEYEYDDETKLLKAVIIQILDDE